MAEELAPFRRRIDELDREIVRLLAARFAVVREVATLKQRRSIPVLLPDRVHEVKEQAAALGAPLGVDGEFLRRLYGFIIDEACRIEHALIDADEDRRDP